MGVALQHFLEGAEAGDVSAMVCVARIYSTCTSSYHDDTKAFHWWTEAILQDDPLRPKPDAIRVAHAGLSLLYEEGRGMNQPIPAMARCHRQLAS